MSSPGVTEVKCVDGLTVKNEENVSDSDDDFVTLVGGEYDHHDHKSHEECKDNSSEIIETEANSSNYDSKYPIDASKKCPQIKKGKDNNTEKEHKTMKNSKDIDILLIGKTGNGKSRTGNTILQKEVFEYTDSSSSVTQDVKHGCVQYGSRRIKVVDCPGMEDTANMTDIEKTTRFLIEKMGDVVIKHPDGYHAFLLVVRYGGRFTKEDKCVISTLKSIFGEEIISQFSILLMTHGDIFHSQNKTNKKFKQWCTEQKEVLKELMEECGNRVILFDNETNDKRKIDKQMKKMIKTIDNLQSRGMRYNHDYFQRALKNRERLLVAVKEPRILDETSKEFTIISSELEKLKNKFSDESIEQLKLLQNRTLEIQCKVHAEDNNTGALIKVIELIDSLSKMIANRLEVTVTYRKKESDLNKEKTSLLKSHNEEINKLNEIHEHKTAEDKERWEIERKKMDENYLEQEKRMQANYKQNIDKMEKEKKGYQIEIDKLKKEHQESQAEDKSKLEEKIAEMQCLMNGSIERETKEKQGLQEELNKLRQFQMEETKKHEETVKEEVKKENEKFLFEKNKLINQHKTDIKGLKEREEKLIKKKKEIKDNLEKEKEDHIKTKEKLDAVMLDMVEKMNLIRKEMEAHLETKQMMEDLENKLSDKTSTFGKRFVNLCKTQ